MKTSLKPSSPSMNLLQRWRKKRSSSFKDKSVNYVPSEIAIYQAQNLADCSWPQTPEGRYAQSFLAPLIQNGTSRYIENVKTDLRVLVWGDLTLPLTINEAEYDNSYVCSPYSYFISYARESLDFISQAWLYHSLNALLLGLGKVFRKCHFNKVVVVNNWLYSTNLYPHLQPEQVRAIAQFLRQSFPNHALVFRCVDPSTSPVCYQTLQESGFEYIATRQIYFLDPNQSSFAESRLFKSDLKLLHNSEYEVMDGQQIKEEDFPRLLELYRDLYIGKYSTLNPKFNQEFLSLVLKKNLMHFKALKKNGRIDGVVGYVQRNGKMYCPFFGYDRNVPKEASLYRLLSTILMLEAYEKGLFFHQSSGASMFKKIRKAEDCTEFTAVFYQHLPLKRHLPWILLKSLYNTLGKKYMKEY